MAAILESQTEQPPKRRNRQSVKPTGDLVPGKVLHLSAAMEVTGWGHQAFAKARKNGLKMIYAHNRAFVETDEIIAYLRRQSSTPPVTHGK